MYVIDFCFSDRNSLIGRSYGNYLKLWLLLVTIIKVQVISFAFQPQNKHTRWGTSARTKSPNTFLNYQPDHSLNNVNSTLAEIDERYHLSPFSNCSRREILSLCPALGIALSARPTNAEPKSQITTSQPYSSTRKQKSITLSNGLKVLLVNDKLATQSTVSLVVNGVGQFYDPVDLPGLAHLMEHMVLSYNKNNILGKQPDFEDWLEDYGGTSNGFTAFQQTCFYFNCPHEVAGRALLRFSSLFLQSNVIDTCQNHNILQREVQRVDSELDLSTLYAQIEYVTKSFVNFENPYSRFTRGNKASLESIPKLKSINVSERLIQFFSQYYLPSQAVLVVVSNQKDLSTLQRWISISPFNIALSTRKNINAVGGGGSNFITNFYPGRFLRGNCLKHLILYSPEANDKETLIIQWVLNEDYRNTKINNAVEIAFVLNQILGRRGPGSLYLYLRQQGWIQNGSTLPAQISVPVNVSGLQILKLELSLTLDGFIHRNKVVAAVYDSINVLRNERGVDTFVIPREIMAQYATTAKLFGYTLSPRPPNAVELALDVVTYGIIKVELNKWYRFPSTEELGGLGLNRMRRAVSSALNNMVDPENALIIVTAGAKAIDATHGINVKNPVPSLSSSKWKTERISGGRLYFEEMLSRSRQSYLSTINNKEDFLPQVYNPFVLTSLRPPRNQQSFMNEVNYDKGNDRITWAILTPRCNKIPLPKSPPETNCRCAFILQLLSSRPTTASAEEAAKAELWKHSFYIAASDLAELGAPGGLAYELRFNANGLRISFLGLSQTIGSYSRRMIQILMKHQQQLLKSKTLPDSVINSALMDLNKARGLSPSRKRIVLNTIKNASSKEVAMEGMSFLQSVTGVVAFSEGDILPGETEALFNDLRNILKDSIGDNNGKGIQVIPSVDELVDVPVWKPRNASPCYIAGVSLISDACGRVLR